MLACKDKVGATRVPENSLNEELSWCLKGYIVPWEVNDAGSFRCPTEDSRLACANDQSLAAGCELERFDMTQVYEDRTQLQRGHVPDPNRSRG